MNARIVTVAVLAALVTSSAIAAEPIEGIWKRNTGVLLRFSRCGADSYCGTALSGKFKGQSIGSMSGSGGVYKGTINVLNEGKTYSGKASVSGNSMTMSGCVLGGLICKSETLLRQ